MNKCKRKGWIIGLIWLGIVCSGCGAKVSDSAPEKEDSMISVENMKESQESEELPEKESQESEAEIEETIQEESILEETTTEETTTVDEARMTYETYKESYDSYAQKLSEAMTTLEMNDAASGMYEVSDQCLNALWDVICDNVSEEAYEEILTQQREWISEKEAAKDASAEELSGGTLAPVDTMITQAEMTMQRCEVLLQYIEDNCETPDE